MVHLVVFVYFNEINEEMSQLCLSIIIFQKKPHAEHFWDDVISSISISIVPLDLHIDF